MAAYGGERGKQPFTASALVFRPRPHATDVPFSSLCQKPRCTMVHSSVAPPPLPPAHLYSTRTSVAPPRTTSRARAAAHMPKRGRGRVKEPRARWIASTWRALAPQQRTRACMLNRLKASPHWNSSLADGMVITRALLHHRVAEPPASPLLPECAPVRVEPNAHAHARAHFRHAHHPKLTSRREAHTIAPCRLWRRRRAGIRRRTRRTRRCAKRT